MAQPGLSQFHRAVTPMETLYPRSVNPPRAARPPEVISRACTMRAVRHEVMTALNTSEDREDMYAVPLMTKNNGHAS